MADRVARASLGRQPHICIATYAFRVINIWTRTQLLQFCLTTALDLKQTNQDVTDVLTYSPNSRGFTKRFVDANEGGIMRQMQKLQEYPNLQFGSFLKRRNQLVRLATPKGLKITEDNW